MRSATPAPAPAPRPAHGRLGGGRRAQLGASLASSSPRRGRRELDRLGSPSRAARDHDAVRSARRSSRGAPTTSPSWRRHAAAPSTSPRPRRDAPGERRRRHGAHVRPRGRACVRARAPRATAACADRRVRRREPGRDRGARGQLLDLVFRAALLARARSSSPQRRASSPADAVRYSSRTGPSPRTRAHDADEAEGVNTRRARGRGRGPRDRLNRRMLAGSRSSTRRAPGSSRTSSSSRTRVPPVRRPPRPYACGAGRSSRTRSPTTPRSGGAVAGRSVTLRPGTVIGRTRRQALRGDQNSASGRGRCRLSYLGDADAARTRTSVRARSRPTIRTVRARTRHGPRSAGTSGPGSRMASSPPSRSETVHG